MHLYVHAIDPLASLYKVGITESPEARAKVLGKRYGGSMIWVSDPMSSRAARDAEYHVKAWLPTAELDRYVLGRSEIVQAELTDIVDLLAFLGVSKSA